MLTSTLLIYVQWLRVMAALAANPAEDQFGQEVRWAAFESKPFVLVIADNSASQLALDIGTAIQRRHNHAAYPGEEHLQSSPSGEKLKVIPVAALPDVPGIFKWLFRRGFRSEAKTGVILDWDSKLSEQCAYKNGKVRLALKLPGTDSLVVTDVDTEADALAFLASELATTSSRSTSGTE